MTSQNNPPEYMLHHAPGTRSVRVLWLLRELNLPYGLEERSLFEWVTDKTYRQTNPTGRLPFLLRGQTPRSESLAIMQTLLEQHAPDSPYWRPVGHPERADLLQWMQFSETIQVHIQNLNQQLHFIRPPEARSAATIKLESVRLSKLLGVVDGALSEQDYLLQGGFSAADIAMGYTVSVSEAFRALTNEPNLLAYIARLKSRPAVGDLLDLPETEPKELSPLAEDLIERRQKLS